MHVKHSASAAHVTQLAPIPVGYVHAFVQLHVRRAWQAGVLNHPKGLDVLGLFDVDLLLALVGLV